MGNVIQFPVKLAEANFGYDTDLLDELQLANVKEEEFYDEELAEGYKGLEEFYKEVAKEVWYIDENGELKVR